MNKPRVRWDRCRWCGKSTRAAKHGKPSYCGDKCRQGYRSRDATWKSPGCLARVVHEGRGLYVVLVQRESLWCEVVATASTMDDGVEIARRIVDEIKREA